MKPTQQFLADSLNEVFGTKPTMTKQASAAVEADPVVTALVDMDRAAEMFETLGMVKVAKKIGKVMKKVTKKVEEKGKGKKDEKDEDKDDIKKVKKDEDKDDAKKVKKEEK